tara:strand:- start:448 stop:594 length:147 start_codon:yes stop_codon:yes gene_type:complete
MRDMQVKKIGRPKLTEAYRPLQISVPARLHEELKVVVKQYVKLKTWQI